ncbi:MAG: hypothetical protein PHW04_03305 [Candidatus Wallbacteria bacterium]|nr:hypothetical protein [Candidatus Wallbacteria bacterium]
MKRIQQLTDIRDIKSMQTIGGRCVPKVQRSAFLELYTLAREKDRLEKEAFSLDKRRNAIRRRLDTIHNWIEKLQKEIFEKQKPRTLNMAGNVPAKPLKTFSLKY